MADWTNLFAVLGTTYGTDGANRKLPNLQGSFVRGWTSSDSSSYDDTLQRAAWCGRNPDPSRTRGSISSTPRLSTPTTTQIRSTVTLQQFLNGGGFGGNGVNEVEAQPPATLTRA